MSTLNLKEMTELAGSDETSSQPKYEQLREYVVSQIESGALKAGAALPSENRLAENLQIARSTVRQALAALERDGLVLRVHGKGTFVHDEAKQRLRKSQDLFALIVPETETAFYPSLQRSFERAAAELHNQVVVCNSNNDIDKQASAILQLIDLRVYGVAIVPTTNPPTPSFHIRQLQKNNIPVVCCSRPVQGVQAPLLAIPFEEVGQRAGEKIRQAGHQHVAFFGSAHGIATDYYEKGLRKALGGGVQVDVFVGTGQPTDYARLQRECSEAIDSLFGKPDTPTAIFCGFDSLAETIYMLLAQRGIRVPQDVSLIGFGGTHRGGGIANHLSSVTIDEIGMGEQAIELLSKMRNGQLPIDSTEVRQLPLSFNAGSTLADAPVKK
ncbi:substrate-binding domain-containing protein [Blastopirellula sp. JC732]|uniref:Substrate-binding domain-containing protein n=1 Tax=Blastopirellula sediminis TaxID=2894196 RepID=A0A9X1SHF4_9BACT|nr:substrate-binding domain-containing protein [Blastopirellula sediminis]MCC9605535.1 substrate-binding domain-containing protein [Blastopirellula sediminis]MCC9631165.1 substrate-binding domain-containing protein [Blastopirellula sediminis]